MISRSCFVGEALELGQAGHVHLLVVDDLAQHAGRVEAGHAGQVDGGLGVAGPLEHAALAVARAGRCGRAGPGRRAGWPGRSAPGWWRPGRRPRCRWWCRGGSRRVTVNAVRMLSVFVGHHRAAGRARRARSPVIGTQMTPEVWRRKKAIFSGVADSAAMMRSPSFSRSSSSTTTTISPRPMAATASSMGANARSGPLVMGGIPRSSARRTWP